MDYMSTPSIRREVTHEERRPRSYIASQHRGGAPRRSDARGEVIKRGNKTRGDAADVAQGGYP